MQGIFDCFFMICLSFCVQTPNLALHAQHPTDLRHRSLSPPIRSKAYKKEERSANLLEWMYVRGRGGVTSSITTEFPLMTTIPILTFSPPAFSSTASSRTMFRNTCSRRRKTLARRSINSLSSDILVVSMETEGELTSYPLSTPMTFRLPFSWTKSRLSRY